MKFGYNRPSTFREIVDGQTTDGRQGLPILYAPPEPSAQVS